ncbi:MAG: glutathione S-transferase family protein [Croceibacterium sp.]
MDTITITGFREVPPFARGLVRDIRLRWVLNELGRPYDVKLIEQSERSDDAFLALQPFGMVPSMTADGSSLFESGAIVFLLAEGTELAGPAEARRGETLAWIFAALNTVEPYITLLFVNDRARADKSWAQEARPDLVEVVNRRLAVLEVRLTAQDYLLERFSAADIVMVTTLRFLPDSALLDPFPAVSAYVARCEARPAFKAALEGHLADLAPVAQAA